MLNATQPDSQNSAVAHADAVLRVLSEQLGMGFWRIVVANGDVHWSEQIFDIHGLPPQAEPLSMEAAMSHIVEHDRPDVVMLLKRTVAEKRGQKVIACWYAH